MLFAHGEIIIGWIYLFILLTFLWSIGALVMGLRCRRGGWLWLIVAVLNLVFGIPAAFFALLLTPFLLPRRGVPVDFAADAVLLAVVLFACASVLFGVTSLRRWHRVRKATGVPPEGGTSS